MMVFRYYGETRFKYSAYEFLVWPRCALPHQSTPTQWTVECFDDELDAGVLMIPAPVRYVEIAITQIRIQSARDG